MATALDKINKRVKHLARLHPGKKRVTLQKQAGAEYRAGKLGRVKKKKSVHKKSVHRKKHHTKKKSVGSPRRGTTNVGTDRLDRKRVNITVGGLTTSQHYAQLKDRILGDMLFFQTQKIKATTKADRNKAQKKYNAKLAEYKRLVAVQNKK